MIIQCLTQFLNNIKLVTYYVTYKIDKIIQKKKNVIEIYFRNQRQCKI